MEISADSYLHKKFKKQLSLIEPKQNENKTEIGIVESCEEKSKLSNNTDCYNNKIIDNQQYKDSNEIVPKLSTNETTILSTTVYKSSISIEDRNLANLQSSKSCISYVETTKPWKSSNFDTSATIKEPNTSCTSSILDNLNNKNGQDITKTKHVEDSRGKYVCRYCNLVCSKPSVLQKHIRAHTNERPYPCNSCGFSFKTRSNLYKHCRSRTHANRVMGNKVQEINNESVQLQNNDIEAKSPPSLLQNNENNKKETETINTIAQVKPYKPRFHTNFFNNSVIKENIQDSDNNRRIDDPPPTNKHNLLSDHINDIINKNNSIVNSNDPYLMKKRSNEVLLDNHNNEHVQRHIADLLYLNNIDEPLNLTKNRKRCMSESVEPVAQKSLIKELLLKNLNSDMQCPHCKMIFQTVTELELHKLRSCKGFVKPGAKYSRSSSVNVASILTQNKNAFDNIPHLQNAVFQQKSPGPFLGKTRLVESDKNKSFSFDDGLPAAFPPNNDRYLLSPLTIQDKEKKIPVKLFGGELKIAHTTGETKSFNMDNKDNDFGEFGGKMSENRVVKSSLQSGGTVLTNKLGTSTASDVIRVYENTPVSPSIDISNLTKNRQEFVRNSPDLIVRPQYDQHLNNLASPSYKYTNIMDFSQKAVKLLTPNLKQPNLAVPGVPIPNKFTFSNFNDENTKIIDVDRSEPQNLTTIPKQPKIITPSNLFNPMKLLVNGKFVRHVPGIPGPVAPAEEPMDVVYPPKPPPVTKQLTQPKMGTLEIKTDFPMKIVEKSEKSPVKIPEKPSGTEVKKFARPNSLALKPTTASLKQHHGLTPTMLNQILISPDTPRVAKKYVQQFLHGNYFSYLGLKCSTKPVYCTLNKTQPFYVPHFKKLSMYSEWRQQDTKTEKLFVSAYDSRQKHQKYTTAGKATADLMVHSSYKFVVSEAANSDEKNEDQHKASTLIGGYESNEDYTYIRGRGRGRYVCDQCGIRCKKPSMLKKHIRTHSNDRPYTCSHCNFSFKTKGNLTKHMKSKAHTKNYAASGSSSSTQQSGTQSSDDSDTEDSGMDSSDESTRREEHEAAYGLLSLSQKNSQPLLTPGDDIEPLNTEEIANVSKRTYAKNKILDEDLPLNFTKNMTGASSDEQVQKLSQFLGKIAITRPLTYPYTSVLTVPESQVVDENKSEETKTEAKNIKQFHVIQKYTSQNTNEKNDRTKVLIQQNNEMSVNPPQVKVIIAPVLKVNDAVVLGDNHQITDMRKRKFCYNNSDPGDYEKVNNKLPKTDEVMDLSMPTIAEPKPTYNGYSNNEKPVDPVKNNNGNFIVLTALQNDINLNYVQEQPLNCKSPKSYKSLEYDNSAMETLADIATKQVKLEKNTLAKSVASEFLKIATKNDYQSMDNGREAVTKEVNDLIVKPEGHKSCHICSKTFSKTSQLRLHMNIHYLERPFRCHSCSVSFRTKGHLQKHERSASHHNKLSSSPALSSSEPRPFKCVDCNIAFRIHGHLAKHLRSKMHIMKLECLAKIPFGLYAELERSNSLLTEINTADGDQCLESLKTLAKKVFINDPNKLNELKPVESLDTDS